MQDKTIENYNKRASNYETKWERYLTHTHEAFIRNIETAQSDTILDVSGGTGLLAEMLIKKGYPFKHLVVNDPSGQMLEIARRRLTDEQRISFSNFQAEELSYEADYFDRIFCLNSFHFYTRQLHVLERLNKMLTPGGRLYVLDWNREGFFKMVNPVIKWLTSAHIDTRSIEEMDQLLDKSEFDTFNAKTWNWRYWKFFFIAAEKAV